MNKWTTYVAIAAVILIVLDELGFTWWRNSNPGSMYTGTFLSNVPFPTLSWETTPGNYHHRIGEGKGPNGFRPGGVY